MSSRLIAIVLILVVLPTALLSILAGRALHSQDILLEKRLQGVAREVLNGLIEYTQGILSGTQQDIREALDQAATAPAAGEPFVFPAAMARRDHDLVEQVVVFDTAGVVVYPPLDDPAPPAPAYDPATAALLEEARLLREEQLNYPDAGELYRRVLADEEAAPGARWEARLGYAQSRLRIAGPAEGIRLLEGPVQAALLRPPRQGDRGPDGALYALTAGLELAALWLADGRREAALELETRLFEYLVRHFHEIAPTQREALLRHVRRWTRERVEAQAAGREPLQARLAEYHAVLWEWEQSRRFDRAEREALRVALARQLAVGRTSGWVRTEDGLYAFQPLRNWRDLLVAVRIQPAALDDLLDQAARLVALPQEFFIYTDTGHALGGAGRPRVPAPGDAVDSVRLPLPTATRELYAYPSNPEELQRNRRLQAQLYLWGLSLLVLVIASGITVLLVNVRGELRQAEAKSEFAAGISHDLRTPLASMKMLAESLYYGHVQSPERAKVFLETMIQESDRLTHMINRVLYFVRLGQDALRYNRSVCDVGTLAANAVEIFRQRLTGREGDVTLDVTPGRHAVDVDGDAFEQVLLNLLDNALKYCDQKPIIHVRVRRAEGQVVTSVEDNGIGMTRAQMRRIFGKYYRADTRMARRVTGVGLGLALCRHIVRAHGGRIWVESEPGRGATFHVALPALRGEADDGHD